MLNRRCFICAAGSTFTLFRSTLNVRSQQNIVFACAYNSSSNIGNVQSLEDPKDSDLTRALKSVSSIFNIHPDVEFIQDAETPVFQTVISPSTYLMLGQNYLEGINKSGTKHYEILVGLLAHEFGHVMQSKNDSFVSIKRSQARKDLEAKSRKYFGTMAESDRYYYKNVAEIDRKFTSSGEFFSNFQTLTGNRFPIELHADFMAGWVLARLNLLTTDSFEGFLKRIYSLGDYFYRENNHHGDPSQRISAAGAGYMFGKGQDPAPGYIDLRMGDLEINKSSVLSAFRVGQVYVDNIITG
jgi:hypothetical protein